MKALIEGIKLAPTQVRFGRYAVFRLRRVFLPLEYTRYTGNSIASAEKNIFIEYFFRIMKKHTTHKKMPGVAPNEERTMKRIDSNRLFL